jgi:RND family efflux transporter MFP subunit
VLASNSNNPTLCTLPVSWQDQAFLAVTLERDNDAAFTDTEVQLIKQLMQLLAPVLHLQLQAERSLTKTAADNLRDFGKKLLGPRHGKLKFFSGLTAALLLFFLFATAQYRVSANAVVEGAVQRAVVSPIDGFLSQANVRAGDVVTAEQLLGKLDDKDLKLEQLRVGSEQQQLLGEYREAMAEHDNAKVSIVSARIDQANAQMKLLNEQLRRTRLLAPFDGIVIEGDLSQALGAPVSRGDVLFKVAPLEGFKIILKVDERDIAGIQEGQSGRLALTSLPGEKLDIKINKITAVSRAEDQRNYFRVEAAVLAEDQRLRPGMEGVGKIEAGERKLFWIWTHKLVDWLRLQSWSLLP